MLLERARSDPQGVALDDGTRRLGWAELADRVTRIARWLREDARLAPGEHVACLLDNRAEGVELVIGAILAGVWITPVNRHLTADEIGYVVRDSQARVLVADEAHAALAREAGAPALVLAGAELDARLAAASDEPMPLDGPAGGNMIYTSGTTGRPKGVKRRVPATLRAALEGFESYARRIGLDGSGPHLVTGPLYHAAPLMFAIYDQACGAPILVMPRWDERAALRLIQEREVHHTHLVPTMFVRLLRLPEDERARFRAPKLHTVLHGAAPVSVATKRAMIGWWGPVLLEYWGGTEGGVTTLVDSAQWLEHPGTVGRAVPGFEVFAVDEAGRRLPPGEEGLLYSRNAALPHFFAYHGDPRKTAEAYLDPYTFTLGDVGRVDAEGWVHLADRRSHMIISGGVNIYPVEIEQVLQQHPAVADVAVFGVPDAEWGESVKAAVQLEPGFEAGPALERELQGFARAHLAGYKVPRSIDFEPELPRTPAGKLAIRLLRERYWKDLGRRI
jgi:acyl-CoA synthetase (AMP-forming)/AMP-acid ligase II